MPDLRREEGGGEFEWAGEEEDDGEALDGEYLLVSEEWCVRFCSPGWWAGRGWFMAVESEVRGALERGCELRTLGGTCFA